MLRWWIGGTSCSLHSRQTSEVAILFGRRSTVHTDNDGVVSSDSRRNRSAVRHLNSVDMRTNLYRARRRQRTKHNHKDSIDGVLCAALPPQPEPAVLSDPQLREREIEM